MQVKRVTISQYKNLESVNITLSSGFNCFVGNNGVGKTNILDALYLLSMTKSYFSSVDSQNVRHGGDFFSVRGEYMRGDDEIEIFCSFSSSSKKVIKRGGKPYTRLSEHIGLIPLVMISPEDSELIDAGSEVRRKWLDMAISQSNPDYLVTLMKYNKVLQHRNSLLKRFGGGVVADRSFVEVLDEQLGEFGGAVMRRREEFVADFVPIFNRYYSLISGDSEQVSLAYRPSIAGETYMDLLGANFQRDLILGYTSVGVHRDDLLMQIGEYQIKRIGSQGQKKSYVIALKLALYEWLHRVKGIKPLLLLDDLFDKLDSTRVEAMLRLVSGEEFGQVFITDTNRDRLERVVASLNREYKIFDVVAGEVVNGDS
ncbi:MAG: DNA replication and repair protein RecF [Marinifilaceae bacterium]|nr:DNA replication and repair protein RecF [Marinifilaceae bacterium]